MGDARENEAGGMRGRMCGTRKDGGPGGGRVGGCCVKHFGSLEPDSNLTCCVTLSKTLNLSGCYLPSTPQPVSKCLLSICRVPGPEDTGSHSLAQAIHSPGMSSPGPPHA